MNRRAFASMVAAGAASSLFQGNAAAAQPAPKARNVVLVHGLFADGSSWSEVIARLQAAGLSATAVQNPLTTLPDAVASAQRVLARQDGPTVLVGHSFSGMIVTVPRLSPSSPGPTRRIAELFDVQKQDFVQLGDNWWHVSNPSSQIQLTLDLPVSHHPKIHSADQLRSVRLGGFHGGRSLLQSTRV